jgi:ABC-type cobalamin transport system permease subunit
MTPPPLTSVFTFMGVTSFADDRRELIAGDDAATLDIGLHVHRNHLPFSTSMMGSGSVAEQDAAAFDVGLHVHRIHLLCDHRQNEPRVRVDVLVWLVYWMAIILGL